MGPPPRRELFDDCDDCDDCIDEAHAAHRSHRPRRQHRGRDAVPALRPAGVGVHTTRLRMTVKWSRPLHELADDITHAAEALSDTSPGVIVFHCRADSMLSRADPRSRRRGSARAASPEEAGAHQPVREGHQRARDRVPGRGGLRSHDLTVENRRAEADGYFLRGATAPPECPERWGFGGHFGAPMESIA